MERKTITYSDYNNTIFIKVEKLNNSYCFAYGFNNKTLNITDNRNVLLNFLDMFKEEIKIYFCDELSRY